MGSKGGQGWKGPVNHMCHKWQVSSMQAQRHMRMHTAHNRPTDTRMCTHAHTCTHTPECVRHEPCSGLGTEPAILGRAFGLWQAGGAGGQDGPRDEEGVGEEGCDTQQLDDEDVDGPARGQQLREAHVEVVDGKDGVAKGEEDGDEVPAVGDGGLARQQRSALSGVIAAGRGKRSTRRRPVRQVGPSGDLSR